MKIKEGYKIRNIAGEHVIVSIGTLNVNLTKVVSLNPHQYGCGNSSAVQNSMPAG